VRGRKLILLHVTWRDFDHSRSCNSDAYLLSLATCLHLQQGFTTVLDFEQ